MRKYIVTFLVCLLAFQSFAVTATLAQMFIPGYYYEAEALSGGTATFTDSSTGAPKNVYSDSSKVTSLGSVVTLDSNGSAVIYGDGTYDIVIKDSDSVTVRTLSAVELEVVSITTPVPIASGGTNATTAGNARTNLGVAIGTDVQAWNADLDTLAVSNIAGVYQASSTAPDNSVSVNNSDGDVWFKDDITVEGDAYIVDDLFVTGSFTAYTQPSAKVTTADPSNAISREIVVTFNTIAINNTNMFDATYPTRLTATENGTYLIGGQIEFMHNSTGLFNDRVNVSHNVDGSILMSEMSISVNTTVYLTPITIPFSTLHVMNEGEYVEVYARSADYILGANYFLPTSNHSQFYMIKLH